MLLWPARSYALAITSRRSGSRSIIRWQPPSRRHSLFARTKNSVPSSRLHGRGPVVVRVFRRISWSLEDLCQLSSLSPSPVSLPLCRFYLNASTNKPRSYLLPSLGFSFNTWDPSFRSLLVVVHNPHSTDVLHPLVPPELSRLPPLSVAIPNDHLDLGTPSPEHVRLVYGSIWMYIEFCKFNSLFICPCGSHHRAVQKFDWADSKLGKALKDAAASLIISAVINAFLLSTCVPANSKIPILSSLSSIKFSNLFLWILNLYRYDPLVIPFSVFGHAYSDHEPWTRVNFRIIPPNFGSVLIVINTPFVTFSHRYRNQVYRFNFFLHLRSYFVTKPCQLKMPSSNSYVDLCS